jgi:hypothetical protein
MPCLIRRSVDWSAVYDAIGAGDGSNGKTTTVRLLAAMLRAEGRHPGWSSTDGVMIAGERIAEGDTPARKVPGWCCGPAHRCRGAGTARGGILRRGLAVTRADVAVITNIAADHFGNTGLPTWRDSRRRSWWWGR